MRKEKLACDPLQAQSQCVSISEICNAYIGLFQNPVSFVDDLPQVTDGCCYEEGK